MPRTDAWSSASMNSCATSTRQVHAVNMPSTACQDCMHRQKRLQPRPQVFERFDQSVLRSLGGLGASLRDSPCCFSPHAPILPLRTRCCHRRLRRNVHPCSSSGRPCFRASLSCLSSIVHGGCRAVAWKHPCASTKNTRTYHSASRDIRKKPDPSAA